MYIAYSALRTTTKNGKSQLKNQQLQQRLESLPGNLSKV
jgi:hypothetical protein